MFTVLAFSIFFAALIYFGGFRQKNRATRISLAEQKSQKATHKDSFDGPFAPHATSSLSMMNELYRQHRLAHSLQRDQQILAELKARLENGEEDGFSQVGIKCKFGRVTLSGRAHSNEEKAAAEQIALSVFDVIDVSNQIVVVSERKAG